MKQAQLYVILLLLAGAVLQIQADDLDAALEAQKKARRHVYSERATLHNQELMVPQAPTDEELALDRKLREIERALDQKATVTAREGTQPSPRLTRPVPENKNWLTPALMDEDAAISLSDNKSDSDWILNELERQKTIKEEKIAFQAEERQIADLLKQESQPDVQSPHLDRLKDYEKLPGLISGERRSDRESSFSTAQQSLSLVPTSRQSKKTDEPDLFSPAAARISTQPAQPNPFKPSSSPMSFQSLTEKREAATKQNNPFAQFWEPKKNRQPTPLEKIRQARPIYQSDPFADDGSSTF